MEEMDIDIRKNLIHQYQPDVKRLVRYLSWMEGKRGSSVMEEYDGEGSMRTEFKFPVYDATLMNFIKTAQNTQFMNRNYPYVYTRKKIRGVEQEIKLIRSATLRDIDTLSGILSKYVLGGMTKSSLWSDGVGNGVFIELLYKLQELMEVNRQ